MKFVGKVSNINDYYRDSDMALMNLISDKTTGGHAVIHVQRKKGRSEASWSVEGSSPVVDVRYVAEHDTDVRIFIKLAGWTPAAAVLVKTTGKNRFVTGRCAG